MSTLLARTMEVNGGPFGGETGTNCRYSYKSLLLDDGYGMDEAGTEGHLRRELEGVEALYRDELVSGRESYKSLLLDDNGVMDEDEIHFSPRNHKLGNGNHLQSTLVPFAAEAATATRVEKLDNFVKDNQAIDQVEGAEVNETRAPPRKRRRGNSNKSATAAGENNSSELGHNAMHGAEMQEQILPLRSRSPPETKEGEGLRALPPARKRKQGAYNIDVQEMLDTVIAKQEMFFGDLLASIERKEEIRERIREEKEDKWRAEERVQLGIFSDAMLALTDEILHDSVSGRRELMNRPRRSDVTGH